MKINFETQAKRTVKLLKNGYIKHTIDGYIITEKGKKAGIEYKT